MTSLRAITLWSALVTLPVPLADAQEAAGKSIPWSCADTSLSRWLTADTAANRSEVEARELLEHRLARTYAPVLRFAPTERYFPTIPFYTAFLDTARMLAPFSDSLKLPLISRVRAAYDSAVNRTDSAMKRTDRPYALKLPVPVVFYRVCDFAEPVDSAALPDSAALRRRWSRKAWHLWDYLRSDEQAWHRFRLDQLRTRDAQPRVWGPRREVPSPLLVRSISKFRVIQYFVYYLQDWGLMGHSEDIEYAFVFIPEQEEDAKSFRVIVGAGHDPPAPNNVLVLTDREASTPRHYHPNILVELGGHSSAPDMPPFGQFSAGLDVNWHIDDVWGTRDEQATAGLSFSGRYEGTMTYPRDPEDAVTLFPRGLGASGEESRQVLADLVRVSPDYLAERAHQASHREDLPSEERQALVDSILHRYQAALRESEDEVQVAVGRSDRAEALQRSSGEKSQRYQAAIGDAVKERRDALDRLEQQRLADVRFRVHEALLNAVCPECRNQTREYRDSLDKRFGPRTKEIVDLLEERAGRIPADSLRAHLVNTLRYVDQKPAPLDAITTEIRQVVTERLRPEYTLVPIRYLQALYRGAVDSSPAIVRRHAKLITRLLHPAVCDEFACGLFLRRGEAFDSVFDAVVCGRGQGRRDVAGAVYWRRSLACRLDDPAENTEALLDSLRMWDLDVYDIREDGFGKSREWPGYKHKIWEHKLYRSPEEIFRTNLFRPTWLQVKRSRGSVWSLFHLGYNLYFSRASNPYVGIIVPAKQGVLKVPFKVPGYLALQAGPYLGQPYRGTDPSVGVSLLYDRQFAYFYGLFLKAQWVNNRSGVEGGSGASDFAWTFGGSIWHPFLKRMHFRPGFRFDTEDLRPLLDRTVFELQLEFRR